MLAFTSVVGLQQRVELIEIDMDLLLSLTEPSHSQFYV
jgi:hypothetical protein